MDDEKSKIDELKKYLNSRKFKGLTANGRQRVPEQTIKDIRTNWREDESVFPPQEAEFRDMKKKRNFAKLFLISSVIFFVAALLTALFVILGGKGVISSQNVEISLSGPVAVDGGETLELEVIISNNNSISLELSDLIVEYPAGTRSSEDLSKELPRERFSLGNIGPGKKVNQPIRAVLFGEEGEIQNIKLSLEYRLQGSNAIFFKEKNYDIEIGNSPVSLRVESLTEVNSGREISFNVSLRSNSESLIENLMLIVEYPFGFSFKEAAPSASFDQSIWKVGDISPGEEKKIKITGILEGQDGEERFFRFWSGIQSIDAEKSLQTAFVSFRRSVFIKKPFLSLDLSIEGDTSVNHTSNPDEPIDVEILWLNNLPASVANVEIEAVLSGDFDELSVFADRGFYNSVNNTVTWSQEQNPVFETVSPGERGSVRFRFSSFSEAGQILNPEVTVNVGVRARRLAETGVSEEVTSFAERKIRFNTSLSLKTEGFFSSGPFPPSGPIPPKAESETAYTIVWSIENSVNDVSSAVVTAKIPSYVGWMNNFSGENISYNATSREIVWKPGEIEAGRGFSSPSKEIAFQLKFLPSLSQVGTSPVILTSSRLRAKDEFTGIVLETEAAEITTRMSSDPAYRPNDDTVVK
ncbi:hypothetical protein COV42_01445 [Candidatus Campbellbacteria bacterium CG11_big_fil_rev_8_21_14_0_20_44_21]|uniref:DUF11 domain-containing protein n=1 Tax=Candidatus Campbellbacteria bacterium CG22_combo_CG10-13_8_21_14_all_43_18 TaxID=1974530 RepID=A0A2H0DVU9_9BACT|nr:MAG: hypothetical protein COW82_02925 [Candidatus Campbellbacteria bacterium CG22_combo_CG10-13_8_21_14_all_43_18]PIR24301.1 MAG: hypothetical protein COV42_01445 [Candidatus Campbellbacteria bacterium CG11_big_fil_rev_8_21_14_0_20_44_21]